MDGFDDLLGWVPVLLGLFAAGFLILGIGGMLKRKWARRELAALRKKYQETDVTDPQYNAVRALYVAAMIEAGRHGGDDLIESLEADSSDSGAGDGSGGGDGGGGGD